MGVLRYASAGPDRLWDAVEERYFITEKLAVERMNDKLELLAEFAELYNTAGTAIARRIRTLKEKV